MSCRQLGTTPHFAFLSTPMPRIKLLLTIAALTLITATTAAQTNILDTPVDVNTAGKTMKQIISEIEAASGVRFSYSDNLLPKKQFNAIDRRQTLGRLLNNIMHSNGIDYKVIDGQIVLFRSEANVNNGLFCGLFSGQTQFGEHHQRLGVCGRHRRGDNHEQLRFFHHRTA